MVKHHLYAVKESITQKARGLSSIQLHSHNIKPFADISLATVQKTEVLQAIIATLTV